jgi:hypothetical protein
LLLVIAARLALDTGSEGGGLPLYEGIVQQHERLRRYRGRGPFAQRRISRAVIETARRQARCA